MLENINSKSVILTEELTNSAIEYKFKHLGLIQTTALDVINFGGIPINRKMDPNLKLKITLL